jgi:hypothetical protein
MSNYSSFHHFSLSTLSKSASTPSNLRGSGTTSGGGIGGGSGNGNGSGRRTQDFSMDMVADSIDYSPFHKVVKQALGKKVDAACGVPDGAVAFTYLTFYHTELMHLQQKSLTVFQSERVKDCFVPRYVTVCLDTKCHKNCVEHSIENCVGISIGSREFYAERFRTGAYHYITWLKVWY